MSSIGNGGIGTKCAETTTRKKCAKIPRSNISGICGMSGILGMPRSNFPRSNGKNPKVKYFRNLWNVWNVWNVKTKNSQKFVEDNF